MLSVDVDAAPTDLPVVMFCRASSPALRLAGAMGSLKENRSVGRGWSKRKAGAVQSVTGVVSTTSGSAGDGTLAAAPSKATAEISCDPWLMEGSVRDQLPAASASAE